jgi:hypothetical protein
VVVGQERPMSLIYGAEHLLRMLGEILCALLGFWGSRLMDIVCVYQLISPRWSHRRIWTLSRWGLSGIIRMS